MHRIDSTEMYLYTLCLRQARPCRYTGLGLEVVFISINDIANNNNKYNDMMKKYNRIETACMSILLSHADKKNMHIYI